MRNWFWCSSNGSGKTKGKLQENMKRFAELATNATIEEIVTWEKHENGKVIHCTAVRVCCENAAFAETCGFARQTGLCFSKADPRI